MWVRDGAAYFFGPIFIHPEETEHEPTKMFYKKEVFLSNLEESCPMTCIGGNSILAGLHHYSCITKWFQEHWLKDIESATELFPLKGLLLHEVIC